MSSPGPPGAVGAPGEEFERLFDEHYVPLRRYLTRRVGEHTGEDLAAETFLTAYRERLRFDPASGTPRSWLFGIATNLLRHQVRHEVRGYRAVAHARMRPGARTTRRWPARSTPNSRSAAWRRRRVST